jgi:hypothetical protein
MEIYNIPHALMIFGLFWPPPWSRLHSLKRNNPLTLCQLFAPLRVRFQHQAFSKQYSAKPHSAHDFALAEQVSPTSFFNFNISTWSQPNHRWRDDSARSPLLRSSWISRGSIHDHLTQRALMYRDLLGLPRISLSYSSLGYHRFRSSSDIYAVAHSVTLFHHSYSA